MFFKKFRRFVRAKARKHYSEEAARRRLEERRAIEEMEWQAKISEKMEDPVCQDIKLALMWSGIEADDLAVINLKNSLDAVGITKQRDERKIAGMMGACLGHEAGAQS